MWQWLCEHICNIVIHGAINEDEGTVLHMEPDKVIAQINVFVGPEFVVHSKGYGGLIITVQGCRDRWGLVELFEEEL
jgi:hypothetical protein